MKDKHYDKKSIESDQSEPIIKSFNDINKIKPDNSTNTTPAQSTSSSSQKKDKKTVNGNSKGQQK